ncbi:putative ABC transporter ATP-binding protein [Gordonia effusa NBRC 100432]|uniref:Putative ABC transporter ATP-binding protein n=1 Tax=Gordonia effusa NBRC 100432 TaxID=1077974 RepID=H0QV18_9ACTN|nr:ABC transporter ATP-binding protein [Gordonia effusa]GAB16669.1 putative ABC transporter ATP-binding protein [Gordonia effusa NBRC 100432]
MTSPSTASNRLSASGIRVGYGERTVIADLGVEVPDGSFTVIVGPNACGKSTLLRALSRLLAPQDGRVLLDGRNVKDFAGKEFAREVGLLPQQSIAPEGISIIDLVSRGRFPYQKMFRQWTDADQRAVDFALQVTRLTDLAQRPVEALSGGQRQRVWIAMALAQQTPILLLDEPTTYLDLAHQIEVLELCTELHRGGTTLVAVLHDLNQAARYATHIIAMRSGEIVAQGSPADVITAELVERTFGVRARIINDPETDTPLVIPLGQGAIDVDAVPGDTANLRSSS